MKRREFTNATKKEAYKLAGGCCVDCGDPIEEYDHDLPCGLGGDNSLENCKPRCGPCHKIKTKTDKGRMAKADRAGKRHRGEKKASRIPSRPMLGTKASGTRKRFNGEVKRW